jgi:Putative gypsy type transposon
MKLKAVKKICQKPTVIATEGHSLDRFFPTISLIVLRVHILGNQEWADDFAQILVHSERRDGIPKVVAPDINDRAHDSFKGMTIYWKMPRCSFRLPLSKFIKDLLRAWGITLSHLISTTWCMIISFEIKFHEFQEVMGMDQPTLSVFNHYFTLVIANHDYIFVKRHLGDMEIFDLSNPRISQIDTWNEGWVYVKNPQDCRYLRGLKYSFTPLQSGKKPTLGDCLPSTSDLEVINKIRVLVESITFNL